MSILLIDDDSIFRTIAVKQLELASIGCNIMQAENGQQGLDELEQSSKDTYKLILLDLNMPIMNGWEFLDEVINNTNYQFLRSLPIWIVTSSINPADIEKSKTYPCIAGFLNKPLTQDSLNRIKASIQVGI